MKKYRLGEILNFNNGKSRPDTKGEFPLYGGNGIIDYVSEYLYEDNIIIGRVGAYCGSVQECTGKCWVSDNAISVTVKKPFSRKYVYYLLQSLDLNRKHIGAAQPLITQDIIANIQIWCSPFEQQYAIASCLSLLDRKIELNKRINRNLEAMARQLYDYWFVQFDFPNEEGKPYKSSGGAMVWNEKLGKYIPIQWNACNLSRYIGRITNGLNPRKNFVLGKGNNFYVTIRSLIGTDIEWNNCDLCDDNALKKINHRSQLQVGDIIFSAIGTIGRTYFIQEKPLNWNISETSFTLRSKEDINPYFFYSLLCSEEIQKKADKKAMGSTLRCLVMDSLCKISTIDVDIATIEKFANAIAPIYKTIHKLNEEKRRLANLRDTLLPLLMNGQVSVRPRHEISNEELVKSKQDTNNG